MSNVVAFPSRGVGGINRVVEQISIESFCLADEARNWVDRRMVSGMILLLYPNATLICGVDGSCTAVWRRGVSMDDYITESLAAIA